MKQTELASPEGLSSWLSHGPGRVLLEREIALTSSMLTNLFGYHMALIGSSAYAPALSASRIMQSSIVSPVVRGAAPVPLPERASLLDAVPHALPFIADSIDVVLMPHVLEFTDNPHAALREAQRVLVGEGHLILTGFNPFGALGLWRLCLQRRRQSPWDGRFLSMTRLKDWLALLGFDIVATDTAFFRLPLHNQAFMDNTAFLESAGERLWPYLGGTYVISAKKRLTTVTPIRPRWRRHRRLVSVGIAEPASRAHLGAARAPPPRLVAVPKDDDAESQLGPSST
ncbi:MAG: SAM-dependent methyltransferase [Gammaproteobacteria bacterium]|jgi:SAM-dependent methyltransferase